MLSNTSLMGLFEFQNRYKHVEGLKEDMDMLIRDMMEAERNDENKLIEKMQREYEIEKRKLMDWLPYHYDCHHTEQDIIDGVDVCIGENPHAESEEELKYVVNIKGSGFIHRVLLDLRARTLLSKAHLDYEDDCKSYRYGEYTHGDGYYDAYGDIQDRLKEIDSAIEKVTA
tara:strand:+ start:795 stop:1307 length:513 start_codon:yes stop_codon:yes gene_type:complete